MLYEINDFGDLNTRGEFMKSLHISFDLPFVLLLPDSIIDYSLEEWYAEYKAGADNIKSYFYAPALNGQKEIDSVGGEVVHIPSRGVIPGYGKGYEVFVDELKTKAIVGLLKRVNPTNRPIINTEFYGDTSRQVSFTSVEVAFRFIPFLNDNLDEDFYQSYADYAISAINKIIEHYRLLGERYYINRVARATVGRFKFFAKYVGSGNKILPTFIGQLYLTNLLGNKIHISGFTKLTELVSPFADKTIRNYLRTNQRPPILKLLNAEVNSRFYYADIRLLIIECAIYFEGWMNSLLIAIYRSKFNMREEDIPDKFKIGKKVKFNKTQRSEIEAYILKTTGKEYALQDAFIRHMGVTEIVNELTTEAFDFEYKKTAEWNNFKINIIEIRNKIVHGYLDMQQMHEDKHDSEKVYNTLLQAMVKIANESKGIAPHVKSAFFKFHM